MGWRPTSKADCVIYALRDGRELKVSELVDTIPDYWWERASGRGGSLYYQGVYMLLQRLERDGVVSRDNAAQGNGWRWYLRFDGDERVRDWRPCKRCNRITWQDDYCDRCRQIVDKWGPTPQQTARAHELAGPDVTVRFESDVETDYRELVLEHPRGTIRSAVSVYGSWDDAIEDVFRCD